MAMVEFKWTEERVNELKGTDMAKIEKYIFCLYTIFVRCR